MLNRRRAFNLRMTSLRRFVTLACLFSFLAVGLAHAGEHLQKFSETQTVSLSADDQADRVGESVAAEVCLCCCLAMAAVPLGSQPAPPRQKGIVNRHVAELRSPFPTAETRPPIG